MQIIGVVGVTDLVTGWIADSLTQHLSGAGHITTQMPWHDATQQNILTSSMIYQEDFMIAAPILLERDFRFIQSLGGVLVHALDLDMSTLTEVRYTDFPSHEIARFQAWDSEIGVYRMDNPGSYLRECNAAAQFALNQLHRKQKLYLKPQPAKIVEAKVVIRGQTYSVQVH